MEEFRQHFNQLCAISQQLKHSQEFLLREVQGLKQELNRNSIQVNHAEEFQEIDQKTLKAFGSKFQDLSQFLSDIRTKEKNTYQLLQFLRDNTARLWHTFETAAGSTITQTILYEDFQSLYQQSQLDHDQQTSKLILLEKEHADLLLQLKDIQLSLERFRTNILQITQHTNQTKAHIQTQQQLNDRLTEQTSTKINQLISNAKDIRLFFLDYKSLVQQIDRLLKLIFHIQTEIEMHHKSILIYQMKFEKYQQDLTLRILHRTSCEEQITELRKIIERQNHNLERLDHQQREVIENRQGLHQQIHRLEQERTRITDDQQRLLENIKQVTRKNQSLEKQIFQSNQISKNRHFSYRKLIHDQKKQQDLNDQLHRTIQTHDHRLKFTKADIDQFTVQITQHNRSIDSKELQIESQLQELDTLQVCFSTTREELLHERTNVNESKLQVQTFTQKLHRLMADEKPIIKEISHYQRQITQNEINHKALEMDLKQNETKIEHYKTIIAKIIRDSREDEGVLNREDSLLKRCQDRREKANENLKILIKKNKYSEDDYHELKELTHQNENENRQLKQQYTELTFIVQLLGQRQAILNNQLKPLYEKSKRLTQYHAQKVKSIEQSNSDLAILRKYYLHLQSYSHQLHQSLSFPSHQHDEHLHSHSMLNQLTSLENHLQSEMKNNSNAIHHWQTLRISAPETFDRIAKLLLIKKKLVQQSNELGQLKQIFRTKTILYRYLNRISRRRQRLIEK